MVPCRSCKNDVSEQAATCPLCGCKKPTYQSWKSAALRQINLAAIAFIVGCFLLYVGVQGDNNWVPALGCLFTVVGLGKFVSGVVGLTWTATRGNWQSAANR